MKTTPFLPNEASIANHTVWWPPVLEIRVFFSPEYKNGIFYFFTINDDGRRANIAFSISRSTCTGGKRCLYFQTKYFRFAFQTTGGGVVNNQLHGSSLFYGARRPLMKRSPFKRDRTTIGRKKSLTNDVARRFFRIAKIGCLPVWQSSN